MAPGGGLLSVTCRVSSFQIGTADKSAGSLRGRSGEIGRLRVAMARCHSSYLSFLEDGQARSFQFQGRTQGGRGTSAVVASRDRGWWARTGGRPGIPAERAYVGRADEASGVVAERARPAHAPVPHRGSSALEEQVGGEAGRRASRGRAGKHGTSGDAAGKKLTFIDVELTWDWRVFAGAT